MTPELALTRLWQLAHGEPGALARAAVAGQDPLLPSTFRVGTLAAATIAAAGLAA
ncbi:CoA transferase, partial [Burkholderia territorii]